MTSSYMYTKKSIESRRRWLDSLKDRPCKKCDGKFPPHVMDWHHRDRTTKRFTLGRGSFRHSREILLIEIEKCDLLCSNCHRIVEYEKSQNSTMEVQLSHKE
jgi:hypothetical protein